MVGNLCPSQIQLKSVRDPLQVFTLLETIYNAFDDIANKRKVFKVETIGDSYVAGTVKF